MARVRVGRLVAGVLIWCLLLAGCSADPAPGPGSSPAATASASSGRVVVDVAGRPVQLVLPDHDAGGERRPLIVLLHGYRSSPADVASMFGVLATAGRHGALVALPEGSKDRNGDRFWNAAKACCDFFGAQVDDAGYLATVIRELTDSYRVDPARVFLMGHSNGGYMALRFGCDHADAVAAVVSVAGAMDPDAPCTPRRPVSVLQVHGVADDTVRFEGGEIRGVRYTSAAQTVETWRAADGCRGKAVTSTPLANDPDGFGAAVGAATWTGCPGGAEVGLWQVSGAGHVPRFSRAAQAALLDWLLAHPRPA
ncbi:MAG: PHB depolymerase family esterase [Micropruina sp.]|uniref:alpha/beta hydrolase family esterase n=1 Tax=Micropruina sp. TaxID=2737536 RepID=UPI0039E5C201